VKFSIRRIFGHRELAFAMSQLKKRTLPGIECSRVENTDPYILPYFIEIFFPFLSKSNIINHIKTLTPVLKIAEDK